MGGIDDLFSSISMLYLLGTGYTVYQLSKHWRELRASTLTPATRQLAVMIAFFLLVPLGVLLHELGHMLAAWSTGSRVLGLHYFFYWGYVTYIPATQSAILEWYVSLAGNFVNYALGVVCIIAALSLRRVKPALRVVLMQLGILELVQTLIFYPLISVDPNFDGDWDTIYSFQSPIASGITLGVHLLSLIGFIVFLRVNREANWLLRGQ